MTTFPLFFPLYTLSSLTGCSPPCCSCLIPLCPYLGGSPLPPRWRRAPLASPCGAAPARRCPGLVPAPLPTRHGTLGCCGAGAPRGRRRAGAWCCRACSALRLLAPASQGGAVLAAGDFGGFPCLLCRKPFQPPNLAGGRGLAVPAEAAARRGWLSASRGIFSSGLTGAPYVCVLLFPFAFYVLSRCREELRSLPVTAGMRFGRFVCRSPLQGCFPECL